MGERDEHRLELRRRDVDAPLEQVPEERAVAFGVARCASSKLRTGSSVMKSVSIAPTRCTGAERGGALLEQCCAALELLVDRGVAQAAQHREAGGGRERVPGERARLVDRAGGRELLHHLRAAAERRERQAAADDLPEHGQVRA